LVKGYINQKSIVQRRGGKPNPQKDVNLKLGNSSLFFTKLYYAKIRGAQSKKKNVQDLNAY
jgi:hypothetical protein